VYLFDVQDVSAWQVELFYDPYSLVVLNVEAGDFFSLNNRVVNSTHLFYFSDPEEYFLTEDVIKECALLVFADDIAPDLLLLGGCRLDLRSVSGSGKVATITFGVWNNGRNDFNVSIGKYFLLDSDLAETNEGSISITINKTS